MRAGRKLTGQDLRRAPLLRQPDRAAALATAAKNPTGHAGSWEDVAAAVRFAVADENGFLNGMVLGVNGGLTAPYE